MAGIKIPGLDALAGPLTRLAETGTRLAGSLDKHTVALHALAESNNRAADAAARGKGAW